MDSRKRLLVVGGGLALLIATMIAIGFALVSSGKPEASGSNPVRTSSADSKQQVEQAYLRFWKAWTEANRTLSAAPLRGAVDGDALSQAEGLIEEARIKNDPIGIRVEHNYRIAFPRDGFASVDDTFVDHSVRIDPATGAPKGSEVNKTIHNSYTLKNQKGIWIVTQIIGYRSPSP